MNLSVIETFDDAGPQKLLEIFEEQYLENAAISESQEDGEAVLMVATKHGVRPIVVATDERVDGTEFGLLSIDALQVMRFTSRYFIF